MSSGTATRQADATVLEGPERERAHLQSSWCVHPVPHFARVWRESRLVTHTVAAQPSKLPPPPLPVCGISWHCCATHGGRSCAWTCTRCGGKDGASPPTPHTPPVDARAGTCVVHAAQLALSRVSPTNPRAGPAAAASSSSTSRRACAVHVACSPPRGGGDAISASRRGRGKHLCRAAWGVARHGR